MNRFFSSSPRPEETINITRTPLLPPPYSGPSPSRSSFSSRRREKLQDRSPHPSPQPSPQLSPQPSPQPKSQPLPETPRLVQSHSSLLRPTNFVSIHQTKSSIAGSWKIDTSLKIPSEFLPPIPPQHGNKRHHFHAWSLESEVDVELDLVGGGGKRAFVTIGTNGRNRLRLSNTGSVDFSIRLRGSSVHAYIPRSFIGYIETESLNGKIHISASLAARLVTVVEEEHSAKHFIGDVEKIRNQREACNIKLIAKKKVIEGSPTDEKKKGPASPHIPVETYGAVYLCYTDEFGKI